MQQVPDVNRFVRNITQRSNTKDARQKVINGLSAVWGCSADHLVLFRLCLGSLLVLELVLRFRFLHPFYSDEGTLPLYLLMDKQQILLSIEVLVALMFTAGIQTRLAAALSWYMYFSLTLRNTWMSYILDRYFHYLLFVSIFLPWTAQRNSWTVTPASVAMKLLLFWIYLDAGYGKFMDPLKGWTYGADPLPALDTYARHTLPAQYLYAFAGPEGLRLMTPVVVWVELLAVPTAMLGLYSSQRWMVLLSISLIVSMHVGIALVLRNAALLSFVACAPWTLFLSPPKGICLLCMTAGNIWLYSDACDESVKHIWSSLLHNRWNVFVGAEEYVTWEIAPGELQDGSFVDVWGRRDEISWQLPGGGAPCTATTRSGRWRSFPYLAGMDGEDEQALWSYLCSEWDRENDADQNPERRLVRFNFFMLQADVLPNMTFSETRKRLVKSYECVPPDTSWRQLEQDTTVDPARGTKRDKSDEPYVGANEEQGFRSEYSTEL